MKIFSRLRAWIHAKTAPFHPDLSEGLGLDLPAAYVKLLEREIAAGNKPANCSVCGVEVPLPFWVEPLVGVRVPQGVNAPLVIRTPYCFSHWPGRHSS